MTPGVIALVTAVPIPVDLGRVGTGRRIFIGEIDTIDRQARQVPGVDVATQVTRLPAEGASAIIRERSSDGASYRAARGTLRSGRGKG